jgi:hypothetical protein
VPEPAVTHSGPWRCPVCWETLSLFGKERRWVCPAGHSFDLAREGYVNLLLRRRRGHQPGDSAEMVSARGRFLASGAYDPISVAVAEAVSSTTPSVLVDVGCGEGHHTRCLDAAAEPCLLVRGTSHQCPKGEGPPVPMTTMWKPARGAPSHLA